ncbi:MAG: Vitamin B12 import ATP-binding protein BtuD [Chlamydiia bacterium]|nr:Vitamin B12 import ATP-binding protein BtuD [Chlamydiia bacterium]
MKMKLADLFPLFQNNEKIECPIDSTYSLYEPNVFYFIEEGVVDLFANEVNEKEGIDRSLYLNSFEKGEILFGFEEGATPSVRSVYAKMHTSVVLRKVSIQDFDLKSLDEGIKLAFCERIDSWIDKIAFIASKHLEKLPNTPVSRKESFHLSKDLTIALGFNLECRKHSRTVWTCVTNGRITINEVDGSCIKPGDLSFPVPSSFIVTAKEETDLTFKGTEEAFYEPSFYSSLSTFHHLALSMMHHEVKRLSKLERMQILSNIALEKTTLMEAEHTLVSVLSDSDPEILSSESDLILKAVQMIGAKIKVKAIHVHLENAEDLSDFEKIQSICAQADMGFRKVKLTSDFIEKDASSFLGYYKDTKTPVIILKVKARKYKLIDPRTAEERVVTKDFAEEFLEEAYVFYKSLPENPKGMRLAKFVIEGRGKDIFTILAVSGLSAIISLYSPMAVGWIFDKAVPDHDFRFLIEIVLGLVMVSIGSQLFSLCRTYTFLRLEGKTSNKLQGALWKRLLTLKLPFFRKYSIGDLFQRVNAVDEIRRLLGSNTLSSIIASFFSILYFGVMLYRSWKLALIMLLPVFLTMTVYVIAIAMTIKRELKVLNVQAVIYGFFVQILDAVKKIRITGSENRAFARWATLFAEKKSTELKLAAIHNWLRVSHEMITSFGVLLMYLVVIMILQKVEKAGVAGAAAAPHITHIGEFLSFSAAFGAFSGAVFGVGGSALSVLKDIIPRWRRAKYVLESEPERRNLQRNVGIISGDIVFEKVSFKYDEKAPFIFKDLNFSIKPGEFVAFTGPSGCGKSTIIRLLLGFEDPTKGKVFFDGKDISRLDLVGLRRKIGVVLQHGAILGGSIRDNINCSRNFSDEKIWETLKLCGIEEEIQNLPMGLETLLPSGGGTLSEGQKQRLLIARALISKPKILVLDEATSSLDNYTQELIKKNVDQLNVSRIVIAHRLTTIRNADRIFVINNGCIEQSGTYEELNSQEGLFQKLVKMQS